MAFDVKAYFDELPDHEARRVREVAHRNDLYDGHHPDSVRVMHGEYDDNVTVNDVGEIVDIGVDFLFPPGVAFSVTDADGEPLDDAQQRIDALLKTNRLRSYLRELGMSGGIAGHHFQKFIPSGKARGAHKIRVLDPANCHVCTDPDDYKTVLGYSIQWNTIADDATTMIVRREDHVLDDSGASWTITEYQGTAPMNVGVDGQNSRSQRVDWQQIGETPWPYAWSQIVDGQNLVRPHEVYGQSDYERDIQHINGALNRTATDIAKILRLFASPQQIGSGPNPEAMADALASAAFGEAVLLPEGSSLENLEMYSDLESSQTWYETLDAKLFELTRTPKIAAGQVDNIAQLSGVALQVLYRPLVAKTETKQDTYGDALMELLTRILEYDGYGIVEVTVNWPDVLPKNELEQAQTAQAWVAAGVSQQTALERAGFDYDEETQRKQDAASDPMGDVFGDQQDLGDLGQRVSVLEAQMGGGSQPSDQADETPEVSVGGTP